MGGSNWEVVSFRAVRACVRAVWQPRGYCSPVVPRIVSLFLLCPGLFPSSLVSSCLPFCGSCGFSDLPSFYDFIDLVVV